MFTGLIEALGTMTEVVEVPGGVRLTIATDLAPELRSGDSLAVNGVCLTMTAASGRELQAEVGPETMAVTTLASLAPGALVNLERPLRADGRIGGHFVLGHVDATGTIDAIRPEADFRWVTVAFPGALGSYLIPKGSVAVDGISLTVAALRPGAFDVQIVPYTWDHTGLQRARPGSPVNIECDVVGKYIVRAMEAAGSLRSS